MACTMCSPLKNPYWQQYRAHRLVNRNIIYSTSYQPSRHPTVSSTHHQPHQAIRQERLQTSSVYFVEPQKDCNVLAHSLTSASSAQTDISANSTPCSFVLIKKQLEANLSKASVILFKLLVVQQHSGHFSQAWKFAVADCLQNIL